MDGHTLDSLTSSVHSKSALTSELLTSKMTLPFNPEQMVKGYW